MAMGLNVILKLSTPDLEFICRGAFQGFKVILHTPGEIPNLSKQFLRVPLRQEVMIGVHPSMITTSQGLTGHLPERRQCFFEHERELRYFEVYTKSACELECLTNFTYHRCGCVKFSMPRDESMKICNQSQIQCYVDAEKDLMLNDLKQCLKAGPGANRLGQTDCNCLSSCTSINYEAELSQAEFDYDKFFKSFGGNDSTYENDAIYSRLTIFFKNSYFVTSRRSELYGSADFLADTGGLLGLFMGVSILSLIEIFYYFTLRVACEKHKPKELNEVLDKNDGNDCRGIRARKCFKDMKRTASLPLIDGRLKNF